MEATEQDDDYWSGLVKREFSDDEQILIEADSAAGPDWRLPTSTARLFLDALEDVGENAVALTRLVVRYSLPAWGDFSQSKRFYESIEDSGMGMKPQYFVDYPHVAYVKILPNVGDGFVVTEEQLVMLPAVLTMSYSESRGLWLVFQWGEPVDPSQVPPGDYAG